MAEVTLPPEWRVVQGFSDYEVSSEGIVRRRVAHRRLKHTQPASYVIPSWLVKRRVPKRDGTVTDLSRLAVSLSPDDGGKPRNILLNRLVCEAFNGPPPSPEHQAAHNDGDQFNNRSQNLRWATPAENQADRNSHGTDNRGSQHGLAILTEDDVLSILARIAAGEKDRAIAESIGMSRRTIGLIRTGRTWRHVPRIATPPKR